MTREKEGKEKWRGNHSGVVIKMQICDCKRLRFSSCEEYSKIRASTIVFKKHLFQDFINLQVIAVSEKPPQNQLSPSQ